MAQPLPAHVDVLAEVADYLTTAPRAGEFTAVIRSLAQFVGAADDPERVKYVTADDERAAMLRLAANAVGRIAILDKRKGTN